jgi:hypothetical protein
LVCAGYDLSPFFRVKRFGQGGGTDNISKEDRDRLALPFHPGLGDPDFMLESLRQRLLQACQTILMGW